MKKLFLILLCLVVFPVAGSHITGGEFEIIYLGNFQYRINLVIYFDEANGLEGNKTQDRVINAAIFRKQDNRLMRNISLNFISEQPVAYTIPSCAIGEVETSRMVHTTTVMLPPDEFNDPDGYYIIWERCCRNYTITNILSGDPNLGKTAAGQTFYLEFPPVVKDGFTFVNSSPVLSPPLSDFGCPNKPYYADFSATDADGDELVYSIVTPWDTHTHDPYPPLNMGPPFPEVEWVTPPYNAGNIMDGNPDLHIDQNGALKVTPTKQGLFVFAIKVEEYRDGEKIGEVRRDFQLFVLDECTVSDKPVILGETEDGDFESQPVNVTLDINDNGSARCFTVRVSDPDGAGGNSETVTIRAIPLGFRGDVSDILPPAQTVTLSDGNPFDFEICFGSCPHKSEPYQIGIIVQDDACAQPLTDTLVVNVNIEGPPNVLPQFTNTIDDVLLEGEPAKTWILKATDENGDAIDVNFTPVGFHMEDIGMSVQTTQQGDTVYSYITWDLQCGDWVDHKTEFEILFQAEDKDECELTDPVIVPVKLQLVLPDNTPPDLRIINLHDGQLITDGTFTAAAGAPINLKVLGTDNDAVSVAGDSLYLELVEATGDVPPYGYVFKPASGVGTVESPFNWQPECSVFTEGNFENKYQFTFRVFDARCRDEVDTVTLEVKLTDAERSFEDFKPANIITPNGDGCNDYFALEGIDISCGEDPDANPDGRISLPPDNCQYRFESVSIFNRWGKLVFHSNARNFRWYAHGESSGVYFYLLKFTDTQYKGSITVRP